MRARGQSTKSGSAPAVLLALVAAAAGGCGSEAAPVGHDGGTQEAATADAPVTCSERDAGCDPVRQTGCGEGEKCSLVGNDLQCVLLGEGAAGDACQAIVGGDSCAAGLICAGGGSGDTCIQFCDHVCGEPCGAGWRCNTRLGETGEWGCGPLPPTCDLLAQDCTVAGEGCYLLEPATATTGCLVAGTLPANAACTTQDQCSPGLVCVASQTGGLTVCVPLCDTGATAPCASGTCSALPGLDPVGYCH